MDDVCFPLVVGPDPPERVSRIGHYPVDMGDSTLVQASIARGPEGKSLSPEKGLTMEERIVQVIKSPNRGMAVPDIRVMRSGCMVRPVSTENEEIVLVGEIAGREFVDCRDLLERWHFRGLPKTFYDEA